MLVLSLVSRPNLWLLFFFLAILNHMKAFYVQWTKCVLRTRLRGAGLCTHGGRDASNQLPADGHGNLFSKKGWCKGFFSSLFFSVSLGSRHGKQSILSLQNEWTWRLWSLQWFSQPPNLFLSWDFPRRPIFSSFFSCPCSSPVTADS